MKTMVHSYSGVYSAMRYNMAEHMGYLQDDTTILVQPERYIK